MYKWKEKYSKYKMLTHTIAEVKQVWYTRTRTHMHKQNACKWREFEVGGAIAMEAENSNIKNLQFKGDLLRLVKQTQ